MVTLAQEFKNRFGPYFTFQEFRCKCAEKYPEPLCDPLDGEWMRTPEFVSFMSYMTDMRESLQFPFVISSGYRCPGYNQRISTTGPDGPHTIGAGDVVVAFERAYDLAGLAFSYGLGVGIAQKGPVASRFIHIDNLGRRLWSY